MKNASGSPRSSVRFANGWEAEIYQAWSFPAEVIVAWDSIAVRMGDVGIFLCAGWFEAFWTAFGRGHELFVVMLRYQTTPQAIFPAGAQIRQSQTCPTTPLAR